MSVVSWALAPTADGFNASVCCQCLKVTAWLPKDVVNLLAGRIAHPEDRQAIIEYSFVDHPKVGQIKWEGITVIRLQKKTGNVLALTE